MIYIHSQVALVVKNLLAKHRRHKRPGIGPWVEKMPWRRRWQPTPVGNPMGRAAWQVADKDKTERAQKNWTQLSNETAAA